MMVFITGLDQGFYLIFLLLLALILSTIVFRYKFLRNFLFLFNPESVHHFSFSFIKIIMFFPIKNIIRYLFTLNHKSLEKEILGLNFSNPIGLAAGFDKDAKLFDELQCFGFGFIEIGTVTPEPQDGNPKPRLFRLKKDEAILNRMGFNNDGLELVVSRLRRKSSNLIIGGNIGKNKTTPNSDAINDYCICFEKLFDYVDYFVVNVSSPNTPNLRELQKAEPLLKILNKLQQLNSKKIKRKPILVKISPDISFEQLDSLIDTVNKSKIDGIIATNTTISRDNLNYEKNKIDNLGNGGISGKPLTQKSNEIIRYIRKNTRKGFVIIGVGGILNGDDALEKIRAGADLLQIYTGFIYKGPSLIKNISKKIVDYENN